MTDLEKKTLLARHVYEEVLYREAVQLGMNDKDYVIKQRLVQKMEYMLSDNISEQNTPSAAQIEAYFKKNQQRYFEPATITFAHVFIDGSRNDGDTAKHLASKIKTKLNDEQVPFENAARYGERFVYFTNYVERDRALIASHFGPEFADTVFSFSETSGQWIGPVESLYGEHLLLIAKLEAGKVPALEKIYNAVAQDFASSQAQYALQAAAQKLTDSYGIDIAELKGEL